MDEASLAPTRLKACPGSINVVPGATLTIDYRHLPGKEHLPISHLGLARRVYAELFRSFLKERL